MAVDLNHGQNGMMALGERATSDPWASSRLAGPTPGLLKMAWHHMQGILSVKPRDVGANADLHRNLHPACPELFP
jgi:hypothetical protein